MPDPIGASNVTYSIQTQRIGGVRPLRHNVVQVSFGNGVLAYPAGGVPLTATSFGLPSGVIESLKILDGSDATGIIWKYDFTNNKLRGYEANPAGTLAIAAATGTVDDNDNAATLGHAVYVVPVAGGPAASAPTAEASATGLIKDSDTASADGVIVYVVVDDPNWSPTYQLGHFEFVSPTNANGTCTVANGAETLTLFDDDDAATNGVATRIVAASGGWEATTAASKDILVPVSDGKFIHVNHATTGSTPTVYFDEDAANSYDRLQATMVDDADEPYLLFITPTEEGPRTSNRGFPLAQLVTVGPKPFIYAVGSGGPTILVASRPDAASIPGAVALYVQAAGAGFNAATFGKNTVYVVTSDGSFIPIAYAASPAGVQVYGYPEGATTDLTLLAVVADDADETFTTSTAIGWKSQTLTGTDGSLVELDGGSDTPAAQTLFVEVTGY